MLDFDKFTENWLGQVVEFNLFGEKRTSEVVQVTDDECAHGWVIVELYDKGKQIKVGGPYQAFRRLMRETLDTTPRT